MIDIQDAYQTLRSAQTINVGALTELCAEAPLLDVQAAALAALIRKRLCAPEECLTTLVRRFPVVGQCLSGATASGELNVRHQGTQQLLVKLNKAQAEVPLGLWQAFICDVMEHGLPPAITAFVLMEIAENDVSWASTKHLAAAMRDSGRIYDYRLAVRPRALVRRYPTGALSEKTALILPALIGASAKTLPIASNFLVAKSLSFTGGTWDKLSAVPGFQVPPPGDTALRILQSCHVVMCVTSHDVAPVDRIFYQLRSLTGSVESDSLIVASICSKQGAVPPDYLLMDVRYGEGAFLQSLPKARRVFAMIQTILNEWQIETDGLYTETSWPTGSTIGNAVEVAEAVDVMRPTPSGQYIARRVNEQWCLVKSFFANLCRNGLPGNQHVDYDGMAEELRASGEVLRAFRNLLTTHGVGDQVAGTLVREPESLLLAGMANLDLRSGKEGRIKYCDQRTLGATVNFALGSGGTDYGGRKAPGGVVLRKDLGSEVARGDVLMTICVPEQLSDEQRDGIASRLLKCFCIE